MGTPYIGEIRQFGGNFPPSGWAFCDGQLLSIAEYEVLFILIGTTYGGDGQETFALPDLRGRIPIHRSASFPIGSRGGEEEVTLTTSNVPAHTHIFHGSSDAASSRIPGGNVPAATIRDVYAPPGEVTGMNTASIGPIGGSQPHNNIQPSLSVSFIISLFGVFPSQN